MCEGREGGLRRTGLGGMRYNVGEGTGLTDFNVVDCSERCW